MRVKVTLDVYTEFFPSGTQAPDLDSEETLSKYYALLMNTMEKVTGITFGDKHGSLKIEGWDEFNVQANAY